jgi:hypothetical protein
MLCLRTTSRVSPPGLSHSLSLSLQDEGCVALSLALAPHPSGVNSTIDTLVLWGNNIEAGGAKALADALTLADQDHFSLDLSCTPRPPRTRSDHGLPIGSSKLSKGFSSGIRRHMRGLVADGGVGVGRSQATH